MSSVTIEREAIEGSGRCDGDWMNEGRCRKTAKNLLTVTSSREGGPTLSGSALLCAGCSDRNVRSYVSEFRSELGRGYFASLVIDGEPVER